MALETDMPSHNLDRDENEIQRIIRSGEYSLVTEKPLNDEELTSFLVQTLEAHHKANGVVATFTGAPASGKTTLTENLIEQLKTEGHPADIVRTDDFNLYHRGERNKRIAEGADPLEVKDFVLLKRIVADIGQGKAVNAPVYDEATGDAIVVGEANFPHQINAGLHYFFIEGDFQPLDTPDVRFYLHLPTAVRRENRIERDIEKRGGYGDREAIGKSFDARLESQYYPFTLPQAAKSDVLIISEASQAEAGHKYRHKYRYQVYKRNQPNNNQ
jgi:uridine kinase